MGLSVSLVWFRNDLRLHDNIVLTQAIADSDMVISVYIFDTHQYRVSTYGFAKVGPFRARFLVEAVTNLRNNLQRAGSQLVVRMGDTAKVLRELALQYGVSALYHAKEYAPEEVKLEQQVKKVMLAEGVEVFTSENGLMLDKDTLPFEPAELPDMFTAFRWKVEKVCNIPDPLAAPKEITTPELVEIGQMPTATELGTTECVADERAVLRFTGGEDAGLARLKDYVWLQEGVQTYFDTRNGLLGDAYSTKFSAWLAAGCLSARQIHSEIKRYEKERVANKSTYWVIFELLWRDFFRLTMEKYHCELFFLRGPKRKQIAFTDNMSLFERWVNGTTDDDFVNANMLELKHTGFMSNRGRQVVASYLVHDLNINWLAGAAYFESMLIDYDVHSNYGNWAYVAGVGNDPRENRVFNTKKQAATYDADGRYRNLWLNKQYA